jgi:outer membrane protein assembly factor BamB
MRRRVVAPLAGVALLSVACAPQGAVSGTWSEDLAAPGASAVRAGDVVVVVVDGDDPPRDGQVGGAVVAFDAAGEERWRWEAGGAALGGPGTSGGEVGGTGTSGGEVGGSEVGATPAADDDVVVVHRTTPPPDDDAPAALCALAADDGQERWCEGFGAHGFGRVGSFAPRLAVTGDGGVVALDAEGVLRAIELADGSTRWEATVAAAPLGQLRLPGELVADGDLVVLSAAADDEVVAVELADGSERWRTAVVAGLAESHGLTLTDDLVVVHGADEVAAFDRGDGTARWTAAFPAPPAGSDQRPDATPLVHGEVVLTVSSTARTGQDGRVLRAFDLTTGELRWERTEVPAAAAKVARHASSALLEADGRVLFVGEDVTVVDPATGELGAVAEAGMTWAPEAPTVDGRLVVVDADRRIRTVEVPGD